MAQPPNALNSLVLDELGRVVLPDDVIQDLGDLGSMAVAGSNGLNCGNTTNGGCSNGGCSYSVNTISCSNTSCQGSTNDIRCA
jgi:hypothetical protein